MRVCNKRLFCSLGDFEVDKWNAYLIAYVRRGTRQVPKTKLLPRLRLVPLHARPYNLTPNAKLKRNRVDIDAEGDKREASFLILSSLRCVLCRRATTSACLRNFTVALVLSKYQ